MFKKMYFWQTKVGFLLLECRLQICPKTLSYMVTWDMECNNGAKKEGSQNWLKARSVQDFQQQKKNIYCFPDFLGKCTKKWPVSERSANILCWCSCHGRISDCHCHVESRKHADSKSVQPVQTFLCHGKRKHWCHSWKNNMSGDSNDGIGMELNLSLTAAYWGQWGR